MEKEGQKMRLKLLKVMLITSTVLFVLTACGGKKEGAANSGDVLTESETEEMIAEEDAVEENTSEEMDEKTEIDIKGISNAVMEERTDISLAEMTEGYISGIMNCDLTKVAEYVVCVDASGTTVDEFGIFKAAEASGDEVEAMLTEYLKTRVDTWMDEYMPEQKPKVENAQVKNIGDYYFYAILDDVEKEAFLGKIEEAFDK